MSSRNIRVIEDQAYTLHEGFFLKANCFARMNNCPYDGRDE